MYRDVYIRRQRRLGIRDITLATRRAKYMHVHSLDLEGGRGCSVSHTIVLWLCISQVTKG